MERLPTPRDVCYIIVESLNTVANRTGYRQPLKSVRQMVCYTVQISPQKCFRASIVPGRHPGHLCTAQIAVKGVSCRVKLMENSTSFPSLWSDLWFDISKCHLLLRLAIRWATGKRLTDFIVPNLSLIKLSPLGTDRIYGSMRVTIMQFQFLGIQKCFSDSWHEES